MLTMSRFSGRGLALVLACLVLVSMVAATWFRAELLRWVNNQGLLEIDSNVKATLQVTIKSKDGAFTTSTSSRHIELDAGEYVLEGVAGSKKLMFQPKEITVTRGGHKTVKAFEDKPDAHGSRR